MWVNEEKVRRGAERRLGGFSLGQLSNYCRHLFASDNIVLALFLSPCYQVKRGLFPSTSLVYFC